MKVEKLRLEQLHRKTVEEFKESEKLPIVVLLDNVRSMHNVGSVFRTSDAFSMGKIYLCGITPQPPHREIQKTALGATGSVAWEHRKEISDLIDELKSEGYIIVGVEQVTGSVSLENFTIQKDKKYAVIMGNEVDGISEEILSKIDFFVEIPQSGTKHSLNVSVCTGIILWECFKEFQK